MCRQDFRAILLGAVGDPRVPSNVHAADILLGIRTGLDLYVNYRPARLFDARLSPLKNRRSQDIRMHIFRENTEGAYVGMGGIFKPGTPEEFGAFIKSEIVRWTADARAAGIEPQ